MKKLSKIDFVQFRKEDVLLENICINIGMDVNKWLSECSTLAFISEHFMDHNPNYIKISFTSVKGITIYAENGIITDINIFPFVPNDSSYYQGKIIILNKILPKPFLSDEIELYFPGIVIEKPPYGYWKRFKANEWVDYPISDKLKLEISMERRSEYVGGISLKEK